ncbi:MAG TPA: hypothetical protein VN677_11910 [Gemmatimonadaceae bacterium]|nr:hypothetical protein [Gemmatimonadaceae bacterium]
MQRSHGCARIHLLPWILACVLAAPAAAQAGAGVVLAIKPRLGDTLVTRFEQRLEMTGTARLHGADSTRRTSGSMLMLSRALVQGRDEDGTEIAMIVDSVALGGMNAGMNLEQLRRAAQGRRVNLRITPDGAITVLQRSVADMPDLGALVSALQSTLPAAPVAPGASWRRAMAVPVAGASDAEHVAMLSAVYRLDSLSADSSQAWISMHGTISRSAPASAGQSARVESTGEVTGGMQIDRALGWWVESHATITLTTTLTPGIPGTSRPARVETRITEEMRARPSH